jgi:hypothetical protein
MKNIATAMSFRKKTNHWLHFFIVMVCAAFGLYSKELLPLLFYMFVWCMLAVSESMANEKVFRNIELALAGSEKDPQ